MKTEKSGASARNWVKKALCAGVIIGLSMTAVTSIAGQKPKKDNGNTMTPFARIAHVQVVKDEYGNIDREATYKKANAVALAIASYVNTYNDKTTSGFPADWIVGGMEGGTALEDAIMKIPSPNPVDPDNLDLGIKKAMSTGMHHATALPCEISVQIVDRDENGSFESLVISYLDPFFMFGAMFSDMTEDEMAALGHVPGYIIDDLQNIVQFALDDEDDELELTLNDGEQFYYNMLP